MLQNNEDDTGCPNNSNNCDNDKIGNLKRRSFKDVNWLIGKIIDYSANDVPNPGE